MFLKIKNMMILKRTLYVLVWNQPLSVFYPEIFCLSDPPYMECIFNFYMQNYSVLIRGCSFADLAEKALVADFETAVHYAGK